MVPEQLLKDLRHVNGFDEPAFIEAHKQPAVTSVRINPRKDIGLFTENEKVPWCDYGVYLNERPVFTLDPAYHAGAYYVQEASSMFLHHMLLHIIGDKTNLRVLDLCGAPGGKSTLIASLLDKDSLLVSNEVIRTRVPVLEENMVRWGYTNAWVAGNDPRDFAKLGGYFDIMVVDAPCSGSGLWRKDARALNEWSEANVQLCSERQQRILADAWPALKQDGILVYATCSYSPQEDEDILDWVASQFDVRSVDVPLANEWGIVKVASAKQMTGYRFFPGKVKGEGFFIAAFQKNEASETLRSPKYKSANDKKIQQQASFLLQHGDFCFVQSGREDYCAINTAHELDWHLLQKAVYLRKAGVSIGTPAAKEWLPAHDIALSIDAATGLPYMNVTKEQALRFLKKEDTGIADIEKGWLMIKYNGLGLGWVKSLGNRVNNYLPKHWRIRMDIE